MNILFLDASAFSSSITSNSDFPVDMEDNKDDGMEDNIVDGMDDGSADGMEDGFADGSVDGMDGVILNRNDSGMSENNSSVDEKPIVRSISFFSISEDGMYPI